MSKIVKKINMLLWICLIMVLNSCGYEGYCVEADDFGLPKYYIDSNVALGDLISPDINGRQVSKWVYSGYQTDGTNLIILVRDDSTRSDNTSYMYSPPSGGGNSYNGVSRWSPWGVTYDTDNIFSLTSQCSFKNNNMCYANLFQAPITNAPCYFLNGIGLYMLITAPNTADPNGSVLSAMNPEAFFGSSSALVAHLGLQTAPSALTFNYNQSPPDNFKSGLIYFKILDNLYQDNLGGYQIVMKSGFQSADDGFVMKCINYVKGSLAAAQQTIFNNVIQNSTFISITYLSLILHIIYLGIKLALGLAEFSQREFAVRVFKISLVFVLLSDMSWNFFYNYFFTIFIDGVTNIESYASQNGGNDGVFGMLDKFLGEMASFETCYKFVGALFGSGGVGFIAVIFSGIALLIGIILSLMMMFKTVIIYCISLVSTAITVALAPIFMVLALFDFFKHLYTSWLKRFITNAVEIVLITVFLNLFCQTINTYFHKSLGFKVCLTEINKKYISSFKYYMPVVNLSQGVTDVLVPEFFIDAESPKGCQPYQCVRSRYADLPYLDPNDSEDMKKIEQIKNGQYMVIGDGLKLLLTIYFMSTFFDGLTSLAGLISGSSGLVREGLGSGVAKMVNELPGVAKSLGMGAVDLGGRAIYGEEGYRQRKERLEETLGAPRKFIRKIADTPNSVGRSISRGYDKITKVGEIKDWANYKRNRAGMRVDAGLEFYGMAKNHLLSSVTFGLLGKNSDNDYMEYGGKKLKRRDVAIEVHGKQLGWSREKIDNAKGKAEKISGHIKKAKYASILAVTGALTGGVGVGVVAGISVLGYSGKKAYDTYTSVARNDIG